MVISLLTATTTDLKGCVDMCNFDNDNDAADDGDGWKRPAWTPWRTYWRRLASPANPDY